MHYQDRSPKGAGVHPFTALEEYVERRTGSSEVTLETMGIFACWDGCRSRGSASGGDHPREAGEGRRRRSGPDGQDRLGSWTRSSRSGVGGAAGGTAARRDACVRRLRGAAVAAVAVRTRVCAAVSGAIGIVYGVGIGLTAQALKQESSRKAGSSGLHFIHWDSRSFLGAWSQTPMAASLRSCRPARSRPWVPPGCRPFRCADATGALGQAASGGEQWSACGPVRQWPSGASQVSSVGSPWLGRATLCW